MLAASSRFFEFPRFQIRSRMRRWFPGAGTPREGSGRPALIQRQHRLVAGAGVNTASGASNRTWRDFRVDTDLDSRQEFDRYFCDKRPNSFVYCVVGGQVYNVSALLECPAVSVEAKVALRLFAPSPSIRLIATLRSRRVSMASSTSPIPPLPSTPSVV